MDTADQKKNSGLSCSRAKVEGSLPLPTALHQEAPEKCPYSMLKIMQRRTQQKGLRASPLTHCRKARLHLLCYFCTAWDRPGTTVYAGRSITGRLEGGGMGLPSRLTCKHSLSAGQTPDPAMYSTNHFQGPDHCKLIYSLTMRTRCHRDRQRCDHYIT